MELVYWCATAYYTHWIVVILIPECKWSHIHDKVQPEMHIIIMCLPLLSGEFSTELQMQNERMNQLIHTLLRSLRIVLPLRQLLHFERWNNIIQKWKKSLSLSLSLTLWHLYARFSKCAKDPINKFSMQTWFNGQLYNMELMTKCSKWGEGALGKAGSWKIKTTTNKKNIEFYFVRFALLIHKKSNWIVRPFLLTEGDCVEAINSSISILLL